MNSPLTYDHGGNGFPILCLHGHPGSRNCMKVFTTHLSQEWMTISPDLRGYGSSKTNQSFEMLDHVSDVIELLDSLQIPKVIILGWSLGGIIGTELALRHPERVTGLILVASAAHPRGNHPPITWQDNVLTVMASILNRIMPGFRWNRDVLGRRSLYRYLIQTHSKQVYQYLAQDAWPAFFQTSKWAHQALNQAIRQGYNRTEDLDNIHCPTLVLAGECDRHITAEASRRTHLKLRHSTWICYPQTAHLFPWEIPERVAQDISSWLNRSFIEPNQDRS